MATYNQWDAAWNDVIRYVIYPDTELKNLMMIPAGTDIVTFVDKYFIKSGLVNEVLKDENVRIIYKDTPLGVAGNENVINVEFDFDIYVRTTNLRNATKDRLMLRTDLIASRLRYLLVNNPNLSVFSFRCIGDESVGSKAIGYSCHNLAFVYKRTY